MAYKALYRTYRPKSFEEVVGQDQIVKTLKNSISQNKIAHAYLFSGPRGTGKTSIAKLFAKAVNCTCHDSQIPCDKCDNCKAFNDGAHPDIVELDAASNNGVDEIRDLIEKVKYIPIQGKYKVYIIDEVHMLSSNAFNALLKTLEEPPSHVIFILATTDPQKVLPTIISRCQRYNFAKVEDNVIVKRLKKVLECENVDYDEEALELIAELADGGMRDALSILDQCIVYGVNKVEIENVNFIYGITTTNEKINLLEDVKNCNVKNIVNKIREMQDSGIDISRLTGELTTILKEGCIYASSNDFNLLKKLKEDDAKKVVNLFTIKQMLEMIDILIDTSLKYKLAYSAASYFEIALLKMANIKKEEQVIDIEVKKVTPKIEEVISIDNDDEEIIDTDYQLFDDEFILGLLAVGDKQMRLDDTNIWNSIKDKTRDLQYGKYANLLKDSIIKCSGIDFLVLETPLDAYANAINDKANNEQLYLFIKDILHLDKMIYAISHEKSQKLNDEFMKRYRNNNLPNKPVISKYEIKKESVTDLKEKLQEDLIATFGSDIVEIKEN